MPLPKDDRIPGTTTCRHSRVQADGFFVQAAVQTVAVEQRQAANVAVRPSDFVAICGMLLEDSF